MADIKFDQSGNIILDGRSIERRDWGQCELTKVEDGRVVFNGFAYREQLRFVLSKGDPLEAWVVTPVVDCEPQEKTAVRRMEALVKMLEEMSVTIRARVGDQKEGQC